MEIPRLKIESWGQEFKVNLWIGYIGAFIVAIISSMFGFGGGPFIVPLMALFMGLPSIFFNTFVGSARHFQFGNLDKWLTGNKYPMPCHHGIGDAYLQ